MEANELIREFPKGLINWYDFKKNSKALLVAKRSVDLTDKDSPENVLCELLGEKCSEVQMWSAAKQSDWNVSEAGFDYIVMVGALEEESDPVGLLTSCGSMLKCGGRLFVGADNRLGIRYFCGDRDPYTDRNFDGIENYRRVNMLDRANVKGRCYSKEELNQMFKASGMSDGKFYSVFPDLRSPQLIYADGYEPKEELAGRYFPMYNHPETVFLEEEYMCTELIKSGMFHTMANSYLVEYVASEHVACEGSIEDVNTTSDVLHVTLSLDRGRDNAMATVIRDTSEGREVEKLALYPEGQDKLESLRQNSKDLMERGISVVMPKDEASYIIPYIDAPNAVTYLQQLLRTDVEQFKKEIDRFRNIILSSSEWIREDEEQGVILSRGYLDLVPLNAFYRDGEYVFIDQEFYQEEYPANAIIFRMISTAYTGDARLTSILPIEYFWDKYDLRRQLELWGKLAGKFTNELRNQKQLRQYNETRMRDPLTVSSNRQRMNYSMQEYNRLFVDIFKNIDGKKLILFGSGLYAKRFLAQFKKDYEIYAILDNNESKWGSELEGIKICSPTILTELDSKNVRIIICVKNYIGIAKQLDSMGYSSYGVYDYDVDYSSTTRPLRATGGEVLSGETVTKPYHTGYVAGVFDLFHIGHLNMFKRAKEQCEYLIVGVVSDEGVRIHKGTEPFVPFEERIEMVRSCRYVDEAVEIPYNFGGTRDAYRMYHFDCQFSGSDYVNDSDWLAEKEYLEKQGSTMVFFPYTESTSSTKLKKMINERLI